MSVTRIACEKCGRLQVDCICDTPRTNAEVLRIDESDIETSEACFEALTHFARELERDMDEAKRDCNHAADFADALTDALRRAMNTTPSSLADWKLDMRRQFVWLREPGQKPKIIKT